LDELSFLEIAIGQYRSTEEHLKSPKVNRVFFADTDVLTTLIYSEMFLGEKVKLIKPMLEAIIKKQNFDLIILLTPEVKWFADGTRTNDDTILRQKIHNNFKKRLEDHALPYIEIGGDYLSRFNDSKAEINKLLE